MQFDYSHLNPALRLAHVFALLFQLGSVLVSIFANWRRRSRLDVRIRNLLVSLLYKGNRISYVLWLCSHGSSYSLSSRQIAPPPSHRRRRTCPRQLPSRSRPPLFLIQHSPLTCQWTLEQATARGACNEWPWHRERPAGEFGERWDGHWGVRRPPRLPAQAPPLLFLLLLLLLPQRRSHRLPALSMLEDTIPAAGAGSGVVGAANISGKTYAHTTRFIKPGGRAHGRRRWEGIRHRARHPRGLYATARCRI